MNGIHPAAGRIRVFEGALALERGDAEAALRIADEVTAAHPTRPEGWRLRGDALAARERFGGAAEAYEAALARSDDPANASHRFQLESRLWACYSRTGQTAEAYRALRSAVGDLYRAAVGYQDLASLAAAALDAGHEAEGKTLLEFALAKTPASDAQTRAQIEARLGALRK
jgi:tetratricopeptide (TPR) repeat protein